MVAINKSSIKIHWHEANKKLSAGQARMATLDEVQPHWIWQKSRVVIVSPRARLWSQFLCGTKIPDFAHIGCEVQMWDNNNKRQLYGLWSTAAQPPSLWQLSNSSDSEYYMRGHKHITTIGLNWGVMEYERDSWKKMRIMVKSLDYLALVGKSVVLVMRMWVYDQVLDLVWFHEQNLDIDWAHCQLTSPWSLRASGAKEVTTMTTMAVSKASEADNVNNNGNDLLL